MDARLQPTWASLSHAERAAIWKAAVFGDKVSSATARRTAPGASREAACAGGRS